MNDLEPHPLGRRELWLGCAIFFVIGVAAMVYLQGSGLTSGSKYHGDLTQSPHWFAYHGDTFPEDDLLVRYASFNESPVQNAIYWVGSWFVDVVLFNKLVGIAIYGLTAALFFGLVSSMSGLRAGVLAALFFVFFPSSAYEIAGGFSKAWAIGLVLVAVYIVQTRSWRVLPWVMPLAALAYPVSPVLTGAIVLVGLVMEVPSRKNEAIRGFKYLAGGSVLALVPLLYKYFTPPDFVGEMVSTNRMKAMWLLGESRSVTVPLWEEILGHFEHPFFVYGGILLLMLSFRRGFVWKRSWSALVVASAISYFVADFVVPRLYLPDRYSRFSMAVLLVLWFAHNWARVLEIVKHRWVYRAAVAVLVMFTVGFLSDTFKPCDGDDSLGVWEDRAYIESISRAIESEPSPVFVAGHPYFMADLMVQARRPVLTIHRMYHAWFRDYREAIDTRNRDTLRAFFATDESVVNHLFHHYGVTHLLIIKKHYRKSVLRSGRVYKPQYDEFVTTLTENPDSFVLRPPPIDNIVYENEHVILFRLPLEEPESPREKPGVSARGSQDEDER